MNIGNAGLKYMEIRDDGVKEILKERIARRMKVLFLKYEIHTEETMMVHLSNFKSVWKLCWHFLEQQTHVCDNWKTMSFLELPTKWKKFRIPTKN